VIEEGVKFVETAGNNPEAYIKRLKDAGIKVLHKVPGVLRYVKKAETLGADAVIASRRRPPAPGTMVAGAAAARAVKSVIAAGGLDNNSPRWRWAPKAWPWARAFWCPRKSGHIANIKNAWSPPPKPTPRCYCTACATPSAR
jgi:hypothetical protein